MTQEKRVLIELTDLLEVELSCKHDNCGTRMTSSFHSSFKLPNSCPACNGDWFGHEDPLKKNLAALSYSLRNLREMEKGKQFTIRLQIRESDAT
jgi:hypothetical protein